MANINLLPWREHLRQARKKEFLTGLLGAALFGILTILVVDHLINFQISDQQRRNQYIRGHIAELDSQVSEIRDLQRQRTQLIERMRVIQELQGNRPIIVRLLDQLVRTVPDGVFYTALTTRDREVNIEGVAESNNRVSSLMRRLDASEWLDSPNLDGVQAAEDFGDQATTFDLKVTIYLPDNEGAQ